MIETPRGVMNAGRIAQHGAVPTARGWIVSWYRNGNDLMKETGVADAAGAAVAWHPG
jgi:citrate lyase beta subunit